MFLAILRQDSSPCTKTRNRYDTMCATELQGHREAPTLAYIQQFISCFDVSPDFSQVTFLSSDTSNSGLPFILLRTCIFTVWYFFYRAASDLISCKCTDLRQAGANMHYNTMCTSILVPEHLHVIVL